MMILYFDIDPCCLLEVALMMNFGYNLRYSKVIRYPTKDSPLPIKGEYTYGLLSGSSLENLRPY